MECQKTVLTERCGPHCGATNNDGGPRLIVGHCEGCHQGVPFASDGRHITIGSNGHAYVARQAVFVNKATD